MGNRNHYEGAFEDYLQKREIPHFSNRQDSRNRLEDGSSLKNFDFVVTDPYSSHWIIDVKGRRFPGGRSSKHYWKHWTTKDDLTGLLRWESFLGHNYHGLFVFAYLIDGDLSPVEYEQLFTWKKRLYAFIAIDVHVYISEARLISPRWNTWEMPLQKFRSMARPFLEFISPELRAKQ